MKRLLTLYLTLFTLYSLLTPVQAQDGSASSQTFSLKTVKDDTPPKISVALLDIKNHISINIRDQQGIDTIWFNTEVIPAQQDTSYYFERMLIPSVAYQLKAVDIKGNLHQESFAFDAEGILRGVVPVHTPKPVASMLNAQYFALMIGVEDYEDATIEDLYHPLDDAKRLSQVLTQNYTFDPENVQILGNPTKIEIERALDELKERVGENDNLLIFYAGHGYLNQASETGSWMPSDAKKNRSSTWVRNSTIRDYIKEINSRHTLLINDACFGASIFKSREVNDEKIKTYNTLYNKKSRRAMTSGNLETVPDQSIFMKFLIEGLTENTEDYFRAENLYNFIKEPVMHNSHQGSLAPTIPQYGYFMDTGDEGGDFIFIKKKIEKQEGASANNAETPR